jgi:hypothetical protein
MTVLKQVDETRANKETEQQLGSPSRLAAVVEAAYILEAVRK